MYMKLVFLLTALLLSHPATAANPAIVEMQTNLGTIVIQLDYAKAPITANNFLAYVKSGFYKGRCSIASLRILSCRAAALT